MKTMTHLIIGVLLAGFTCSLPIVVTSAQEPAMTTTKAKQEASFLFVLSAKSGVITKGDNGYTLTLQGMDDKASYFSDRPVRQSGFITMTQFMSDWAASGKNSFAVNPPNAAIVYAALETNVKGVAQAISVELTNPQATANGWKFSLKNLQGSISPGTYGSISVFVDNYTIRLNGAGTGIIGRAF